MPVHHHVLRPTEDKLVTTLDEWANVIAGDPTGDLRVIHRGSRDYLVIVRHEGDSDACDREDRDTRRAPIIPSGSGNGIHSMRVTLEGAVNGVRVLAILTAAGIHEGVELGTAVVVEVVFEEGCHITDEAVHLLVGRLTATATAPPRFVGGNRRVRGLIAKEFRTAHRGYTLDSQPIERAPQMPYFGTANTCVNPDDWRSRLNVQRHPTAGSIPDWLELDYTLVSERFLGALGAVLNAAMRGDAHAPSDAVDTLLRPMVACAQGLEYLKPWKPELPIDAKRHPDEADVSQARSVLWKALGAGGGPAAVYGSTSSAWHAEETVAVPAEQLIGTADGDAPAALTE